MAGVRKESRCQAFHCQAGPRWVCWIQARRGTKKQQEAQLCIYHADHGDGRFTVLAKIRELERSSGESADA